MLRMTLLVLIFLALGTSCATSIPLSHLERFDKVTLGMKQSDAVRILGQPSRIRADGRDTQMLYDVRGRIVAIPKIVIWIDKSGVVSAKNIILSKESGDLLTRAEFEKRYSKAKFVMENAEIPKGAHYIPTEKYLVDKNLGLTAEIRGEEDVSSIHWSNSKVTSDNTAQKED